MLKYQLSRQTFDNDVYNINYSTVEIDNYVEEDTNSMIVTVGCDDVSYINSGDILNIASTFVYTNYEMDTIENEPDTGTVQVYSVDRVGCKVSFLDSKYKNLPIDTITAEVSGNTITWVFDFIPLHYFSEVETPEIWINFGVGQFVHLENTQYINFHQINWVYDESVGGAAELSRILFGTFDPQETDIIEGDIGKVVVSREQIRWNNHYNQDNPSLSIYKYKVSFNIPIEAKGNVGLYSEGNINEYFVEYEGKKAINTPIEMEKQVYTPIVVKDGDIYEDCIKINFNLHFRNHSGKDWTVNNSDSWVFDTYGGDIPGEIYNKYYSYSQMAGSPDWQWKRSCQSDLLTYLDFTTNDVKYQKNKLKKSFLRLSYYDSPNAADQRLLAYSTIFIDNNKLYSKFISRSNFECYYDTDGEIVKGIKVDREVNTGNKSMAGSLMNILGVTKMTTEEIEDYRLSSQISVKNKYSSSASSEGFYLYTWENDGDVTEPMDIYMKAEFNHAGYGRNIPMMAPYKYDTNNPNVKGFKTNLDIINDWNGEGYGIKKYQRYLYIHLKAEYDNTMKRYIYYLDPDTYGTNPKSDGNVININLYEARVNFS